MSYERDLNHALRDLKHVESAVRKEAIDWLKEFADWQGDSDVRLASLEKVVRAAAEPYPRSTAEWDDPSYALIYLAGQYPAGELRNLIIQHYEGFSLKAKEVAAQYVGNFGDERSVQEVTMLLKRSFEKGEVVIPFGSLNEQPDLAVHLVKTFLPYVEKEPFKHAIYELLVICLDCHYLTRLQADYLTPIIQSDYKETKLRYLDYDKGYKRSYAYGTWKYTYLPIQKEMMVLLALLEYYHPEGSEKDLEEAMGFADPLIRCAAIITRIQRNLPVSTALLEECATRMETAVFFWSELGRVQKEHYFPSISDKPAYMAKAYAFNYVKATTEDYLEDLELKGDVIIESFIDGPLRYYLGKALVKGEVHPIWIGGFPLAEEDQYEIKMDIRLLGDPYEDGKETDYKEWFVKEEEDELQEIEEAVLFEAAPPVTKWVYPLYLLFLYLAYDAFFYMNEPFMGGFYVVMVIIFLYAQMPISFLLNGILQVQGTKLVYMKGRETTELEVAAIKRVSIERKWGRKKLCVYGKGETAIIMYPYHLKDYHELQALLTLMTESQTERPIIQTAS